MKTIGKMKTVKAKLFLIGCGAAIIGMTTACSKDNPLNPAGNCFGGNWAQQYSDELTAWSNAASVYNENPTAENCDKYKTAAKSYLNALKEVADCVPTASKAEINKAINEAKTEVDKEGCD